MTKQETIDRISRTLLELPGYGRINIRFGSADTNIGPKILKRIRVAAGVNCALSFEFQ